MSVVVGSDGIQSSAALRIAVADSRPLKGDDLMPKLQCCRGFSDNLKQVGELGACIDRSSPETEAGST